ncbi:MAG: threonine--tRNA ligase [Planctomycetes bacterium]|nr:threonine--tRNA ligase [Planctomycetota bacterium]NOG55106.1 threonine--tRNA ligase [Planctomycetota bacterium]
MPRITLPDGSVKEFESSVSGLEVSKSIGPRLAKDAVGCKVDGELSDLSRVIETDAAVSIVTPYTRDRQVDADALYLLRHSCAHIMAEAIGRLKPGIQLVYGPPVDDGFYYDISFPEGESLSSDEFEQVEQVMAGIIAEDKPFSRYDLTLAEGMTKVEDEGSKYKIDNAQKAVLEGADSLSFYATGTPGQDWEDLCRGPHVPSTGRIGAFKVMSVASSYWHGDAASDRLIRVYGTAFPSKKELAVHLEMLEEARKRDHRVIGRQMGLFATDEEVGPGLILWKPAGAVIRRELEEFLRSLRDPRGFHWVHTPHIGKLALYRTSGHFPYYSDSQYPPIVTPEEISRVLEDKGMHCGCAEIANAIETDADGYLLKPMNCPHHIKIYASDPHSYRDLPVRLAEFGTVYRYEQSGECHGLARVRGLTQDDSHIFCTEDQLPQEVQTDVDIASRVLQEFGMEYRVRVGLRDPDSSKYVGSPEVWDKAEQACIDAAKSMGVPYSAEAGEAAFYGPKIDFVVKDSIGRDWQLGTVQVDYNLPKRFDLSYVGADNQPHRPVMVHSTPFGAIERFVSVLIENFAGDFPLWLAPEQVRVLPISDKFADYARTVAESIEESAEGHARITVDTQAERLQAKIRQATEAHVPYMVIVGGRDEKAGTVSIRHRTEGDLATMPLDCFIAAFTTDVMSHGRQTILSLVRDEPHSVEEQAKQGGH